MSLLAYNLTTAPLLLAAGAPPVTLSASTGIGVRGPAFNVTSELKGLTTLNYAALQAQIDTKSIDLAWTQYPEYPTPGLTALEQPDVENIAMYVAPGGNNLNDGAALSPLATFAEAWNRVVASNWARTARIFITGSVPMEAVGYVNNQRAAGRGTPIAVVGSFVNQPGTAGTVTPGDGDPAGKVFTDTGLAMTPGAFNGIAFVLCTFSTTGNTGARANVASNTATSVTLQTAFSNPIADGDTFVIQLPNSELVLDPGAAVFGFGNSYVGWQGIKISLGGNTLVQVDATRFVTDGLVIDGAGGIVVTQNDTLLNGVNSGPWTEDGAANPFNPNSTSGTLFNIVTFLSGNNNKVNGNHMFFGVLGFTIFASTVFTPDSLICRFTSLIFNANSYVNIPDGYLDTTLFLPLSAFLISGSSVLDINNFVITNVGAVPAVRIRFGSKLIAGALTGATGNAGPGITLDQTSQASISPATALTGSLPGLNDVVVAGTPKGYGALPYLEPNTVSFAG